MARKVRAYTPLGFKIATIGKRQRELARVLRVSQQTISKKLRGETAIMVSDLEKLGKHYKVPLTYFFEEETLGPELTSALARVRRGSAALKDLVVMLGSLSAADIERVLKVARVMAKPSSGGRRAAEGAAPYGKR
ncbi:MAG: helix-turn-helix domain-containing protein [Planctomycetota bacterium]|jgi:transcriptional regulator with XRE-family HTH domain